MSFIHEEIVIDSACDIELINITGKIERIVEEHDISEGLINLSTRHTTSAVIINEDEDGLKKDFVEVLNQLVPSDEYCHDRIDNNARSHLMSLILESNQSLPIINGRVSLGTWQSIFFLELDGPRSGRRVDVTIIY